MSYYEFGPNRDFDIRFIGEMKEAYGEYDWQSENEKCLIQDVLHALYQVKEEIQNSAISSDQSYLSYDDICFLWAKQTNQYSITTRSGMTMLSVYERGPYSFDVEFFSGIEYELFKFSLLGYAEDHASLHGRAW